jgi:putative transposase
MVRVLGISRSGYYRSRSKKECPRKQEERRLAEEITVIHKIKRQVYGSPKIQAELKKRGHQISRQRVKKIMNKYGIIRKVVQKFVKTTDSKHKERWSQNLLVRDFSSPVPDAVWVSDITYIRTGAGFMYLCVIIDLYSRMAVGWSLGNRITAGLAIAALDDAYRRRRPPKYLIFHSDGGKQYASKDFRKRLKKYGMVQSMSGKGDPWDNAVAESFFAQLKKERIHAYYFETEAQLRAALFDHIEVFYNRQRGQKELGYWSPFEYEEMTALAKAA